jgi:hypothetical protein
VRLRRRKGRRVKGVQKGEGQGWGKGEGLRVGHGEELQVGLRVGKGVGLEVGKVGKGYGWDIGVGEG